MNSSALEAIPAQTRLQVEVRAADAGDWLDASSRVRDCIRGAALATGCEVEIHPTEALYAPMLQHADLARHWDANMETLGYVVEPPHGGGGGGSTDMGNISQYLPSIHPMVTLKGSEAVPHTVEFAAAAVSSSGDEAVLNSATALALTAADVAADRGLCARLRELRIERTPAMQT